MGPYWAIYLPKCINVFQIWRYIYIWRQTCVLVLVILEVIFLSKYSEYCLCIAKYCNILTTQAGQLRVKMDTFKWVEYWLGVWEFLRLQWAQIFMYFSNQFSFWLITSRPLLIRSTYLSLLLTSNLYIRHYKFHIFFFKPLFNRYILFILHSNLCH